MKINKINIFTVLHDRKTSKDLLQKFCFRIPFFFFKFLFSSNMFCKAFHIFISYVISNIDVTAEEEQNINKKHNEKVE